MNNKAFLITVAVMVFLLAIVWYPKSNQTKQDVIQENGIGGGGVSSEEPAEYSNANVDQNINLNTNTMQFDKAEQVIETGKSYKAILKTSKGDITIDLFADKVPTTVNNFVFLAQKEFYKDIIFHRVIDGFMIQSGDPTGTGAGGPGYKFDDEDFDGEYSRGTVAMANAGPNTNGSQFFIMHQDNPLPNNYVIFGNVTEGLDVVDAIATQQVTMSATGENSKPVEPTVIESVEIVVQ